MNKVLNINLAGIPFTIDDDAYQILENYLQSLHNHFKQSEGYEEIMNDIESRLAELLSEGMGKRTIAGQQDVKNAISIMGKPEDFGAESIQSEQKAHSTEGGARTGKRLFRDTSDKMIGGVCSGLASYFGISDPLWIRLGFALIFFFGGSGFLLYTILWALIPEAKTTAERLSMRGEPVDVNSIAKSIEEGATTLSKRLEEFGSPEGQARFHQGVNNITRGLGDFLSQLFRGIGGFGKIILIVIAVALVIALIISWVSAIVSASLALPLVGYLSDTGGLMTLGMFNVFFIILIPTIGLILLLRYLIFKRSVNGGIHAGMWTFFALNCASLGIVGGLFVKEFNHNAVVTQKKALPDTDLLTIYSDYDHSDHINIQFGNLHVSDDILSTENVDLQIEKSDDGKFEIIEEVTAQGRTQEEARTLASSVTYAPRIEGNKLTLDRSFNIPKGSKWRAQHVHLILKVPVGKKINTKDMHMDSNIPWDIEDECEDIYTMTEDGLECAVKPKKAKEE